MKAWHAFPLLYDTIPLVVGLTSLGFSHALPAWFLILLHHDGLLMVGSIGWFYLLVSMGGVAFLFCLDVCLVIASEIIAPT